AEDVVQEALLGALRNAKDFEGRSQERTWLFGILRNKIADVLRARVAKREEFTEPDFDEKRQFAELPDIWSNPEKAMEAGLFRDQFQDCVGQLPDDFAEAFILREVEGLSYDEVCDTLGITTTNLSTRLYRARMLLRKCLQKHWFDSTKFMDR
ncbi:MAG TPA: sigma-70 family RNA polymerase sigma factor, partial [Fimbriimonadaceae bacterium]|nr:sigma-70 family RNA polymerase sigma factor [Fimbriimonadaceae bacterium]